MFSEPLPGTSQGRCGEGEERGREGGDSADPTSLSTSTTHHNAGRTLVIIRLRSNNIVLSISLWRCSCTKLPQDRWRASINLKIKKIWPGKSYYRIIYLDLLHVGRISLHFKKFSFLEPSDIVVWYCLGSELRTNVNVMVGYANTV